MTRHWTNDEMLDKLYGIAPPGVENAAQNAAETEEHLRSCSDCSARWDRLTMQRAAVTSKPEVTDSFLAAQRRRIYARMEQPVAWWESLFSQKGFAAGVAAILVVAGGLVFFRPASGPVPAPGTTAQTQQQELSDAQFFSEMASIEQSSLPRAASPIKALFQQEQ